MLKEYAFFFLIVNVKVKENKTKNRTKQTNKKNPKEQTRQELLFPDILGC